jgi:hypothetical protein
MELQLLEAVFGDLRLNVFPLALAILAVLLEDLEEVGHGRVLRVIHGRA